MELPNNSDRAKLERQTETTERQERPGLKKVNTSVNKSFKSKLKDSLIAEDCKNIGDYILFKVVIPGVKDAVVNGITNSINLFFYGEKGVTRRQNSGRGERYSSLRDEHRDRDERRSRSRAPRPNDIGFRSRAEAEDVLEDMRNYIDEYGCVTVHDLYDAAGISGEYTDKDYGWDSLSDVSVKRVSDMYSTDYPYYIDFTRPQRL